MCSDRRISLTAPRIGTIRRFRSTSGTAATVLFVLYFTLPVWEWLFTKALEPFGEEALAVPAALCVVWLPAVAVFMTEKRPLPADFFLIILYPVEQFFFFVITDDILLAEQRILIDHGIGLFFFLRCKAQKGGIEIPHCHSAETQCRNEKQQDHCFHPPLQFFSFSYSQRRHPVFTENYNKRPPQRTVSVSFYAITFRIFPSDGPWHHPWSLPSSAALPAAFSSLRISDA